MQRKMDLVRFILMQIEASRLGAAVPPFGLHAFAPEEIRYHLHLMMEDGLIEGSPVNNSGTDPRHEPEAFTLTAKGHDFLDLARDPKRWSQAHAVIRTIGSAPIAVWMRVLNDLLVKELGVAS